MASLRKKLAGESRLPICNAEAVAAEVLKKTTLVEETMSCLLDDDHTVSGRAAYVMMRIGEERPELLRPYKSLLLGEVAAIPWWAP